MHHLPGAYPRAWNRTAQAPLFFAEVVGGVGQFARRQPAVFFGTAVLAGLALSRFLKSSAAPSR